MFKDYGKGIEKDSLERLFTPFYTTKETGTGLGLYTCKTIIERHNGFIEIESEPDKGTTVIFYLPVN